MTTVSNPFIFSIARFEPVTTGMTSVIEQFIRDSGNSRGKPEENRVSEIIYNFLCITLKFLTLLIIT
jgi:hypothetical protein